MMIVTMNVWSPDLTHKHGPRYRAIADALSDDLKSGRLQPGARLPTHRELARTLGVTVGTVSRAYAEAERRGLVQGEVGRGTFARGGEDAAASFFKARAETGIIDLSQSIPAVAASEEEHHLLSQAFRSLGRHGDLADLAGFPPPAGARRHRESGARLPPVRQLHVHGYWNVDNRKVAKSLGNMISPLIMRDKYGFESFRYFLLRDMVFGLDANFSEEALVSRLNADLANKLGNLVSRTLNMTARFAQGRVPAPERIEDEERVVEAAAAEALRAVDEHMPKLQIHRALEAIFHLVDETNRYLELREPWKAAKDPALKDRVATTLYTCCEALRIAALLLAPFLPQKAGEILDRLGLGDALEHARLPADGAWGGISVGAETRKGEPLFPRIDSEES